MMRHSGRTTRLLQNAIACAKQSDRAYVVGENFQHVKALMKEVAELEPSAEVRDAVTVKVGPGVIHFLARADILPGVHYSDAPVYADHFVWERMIEELERLLVIARNNLAKAENGDATTT